MLPNADRCSTSGLRYQSGSERDIEVDTTDRITVRDQTRGTKPAACAGIQIQSAVEIGKSDRSPRPLLHLPRSPFHTTSSSSSTSPRFTLSFSRPSPTFGDFASYSPRLLLLSGSPPFRYKYLPIISRHTGQYHTSVRGLTIEESHPPRCVPVQRESTRRFSSVAEEREARGPHCGKRIPVLLGGRALKMHRSNRENCALKIALT